VLVYGWLRRPIVLAAKTDLCTTCRQVGTHAIVRVVQWVEIFFIPILPFWSGHQLVCLNCKASQKLSRKQVREALKTGKLALPARPEFKDYARQQFQETGRSPQESELDPVEINPRRGPWDLYLKAWLIVVPAVIVGFFILGALSN
jgi:hypothetical protein